MISSRDIIRRLQADGWIEARVKGDHFHFTHPTKSGRVTVPHPVKDIRIGTLRSIYRQAGWSWPPR